jgi:hypothetical protein
MFIWSYIQTVISPIGKPSELVLFFIRKGLVFKKTEIV